MIKIKNTEKILIAILALIMGVSFGTYIWTPNTNSVIAGEINGNSQPPIISNLQSMRIMGTSTETNSSTGEEGSIEIIETTLVDPGPVIEISVEKYRSSSAEGPWLEADTPAGASLTMWDKIYWKIEVENIGEVDLELEFIDHYDGVQIDLEKYIGSLPTSVDAGMTVSITYTTQVISGVHKNNIKVIGTNGEITIEDEDNACYTGIRPISEKIFQDVTPVDPPKPLDPPKPPDPPTFKVPEYQLGPLGGLLSILATFIIMQRKK